MNTHLPEITAEEQTQLPLAERASELVPVGRGGARRAIALANPGLPGTPYATAAIQYLGPREEAPAHRHTQTAFRFVVDGEGVWTDVEGVGELCNTIVRGS
ncbi:cupin domain-containing protein [Nonomuraea guangzhouensis]|uniref:cupin domain-containing protein n=1 Tax=Nonomuraea guangzhouensis TaxID=1291555 RepID=UPI001FECDAEA|nr:cupin domain-containing protein [Nonomuraea guangzhouensis]